MLSEEKIEELRSTLHIAISASDFRAIEAAVLAEQAKPATLNAEYTRGRNDGWEAAMLKVAEQAKAGPVAWLDLEKLNRAGMAYATSFKSNCRQTALGLHPAPAPEGMVMRWIDPNDKTQKQYLPWIGEPVLFCHDGLTYYGQHTGCSFKTGNGATARNFNTWECRWMYPPAAAEKEQRNAG